MRGGARESCSGREGSTSMGFRGERCKGEGQKGPLGSPVSCFILLVSKTKQIYPFPAHYSGGTAQPPRYFSFSIKGLAPAPQDVCAFGTGVAPVPHPCCPNPWRTDMATPLTPGARFRQALRDEQPLQVMGTINANHALLARRAGYRAIYLSGGGV